MVDPNPDRIDNLKAEHEAVINDLPAVGGIITPTFRAQARNPKVHAAAAAERAARKARLENRKALDLSDAEQVGFQDQAPNDIRNLDDLAQLIDQHQRALNRLLQRMQDTLIESINHIEVLERHWQKLI